MAPITCRKQVTQVRPLTSLLFDLVCLIMSKVGAKSSKDVFKYKIWCKVMKAAGESSDVYRELDIFRILKLPCLLDKRDDTLNKCRQHENILLMFRDAIVLHLLRAGDKMELQKIAGKGQKDTMFMNVMLLLVESRQNKEKTLKVLNDAFRSSGRTNEVHQILARIGGLVFGRPSELKLIFHGCPRTCRTHHGNKYGWPFSS